MGSIGDYLKAEMPRFEAELFELLRIPSVSAIPEHKPDMLRAAQWVEARIADRTRARKDRDFEAADAIRGELAEKGLELMDGPTGTRWRFAALPTD